MDKKIIKDYLAKTFLSEVVTPGITITNQMNKKSGKENKKGVADIEKSVKNYDKTQKDEASKQMPQNKFNYADDFQKQYHDQMEIMNGQEMVQYDTMPEKWFTDRALEAIEGSSRMGNNPEWANVYPKEQGFTGPTFGKELVSKIKKSAELRGQETPAISMRGRDIQELPEKMKNDNGSRPIAVNKGVVPGRKLKESQDKNPLIGREIIVNSGKYKNDEATIIDIPKDLGNVVKAKMSDGKTAIISRSDFSLKKVSQDKHNDNNKIKIKESMKRLIFKKEFKGLGNALKLIPESYKVNQKEFEMTDGNETYKIRWEGNLSEGKAVVLTAADKTLVNEDITRMKALFGYKSQDTLGSLKGKERLNENKVFGDIWSKTKSLMTESEDMEGLETSKEKHWDEETKSSPEAKKHVEGSVKKDAVIAKGKEGSLDKAASHAPEAKKHVSGDKVSGKGTETKPKEAHWDEVAGGEKMMEKEAPEAKEGHWEDISLKHAPEAKKHVHLKESEEEEESVDIMKEEPMDEKEMMEKFMKETEMMDETEMGHDEENDEEGEEPEDDSNWAKSDDEDSAEEKEPSSHEIKTDLDVDGDEEDEMLPTHASSMDEKHFQLLSNGKGLFRIKVGHEEFEVPDDEIYTSIAKDKKIKAMDRAEMIYDEMKKYNDL